jgi:S-adenosylmethionine-diacylglycerol 3-amino-3-carboxypropyl transferase
MNCPTDGSKLFNREGTLMFGQVREDAAVDVFLLQQLAGKPQRLFVVASGGCTALTLVSSCACLVDALDINAAQIALVELKAAIFKRLGFTAGRDACMKDARKVYENVRSDLSSTTSEILDRYKHQMQNGLNNAGLVDVKMKQLTGLFYLFIHSRKMTKQFLELSDESEQQKFYRGAWRNWQWRMAMAVAFNRNFLALRHGDAALRLVPPDFSAVMEGRLQRAMTKFPNSTNPYLWQAYFSEYPNGEDGLPPYLQSQSAAPLLANLSNLSLHCDDVRSWFQKQADGSLDYLGMSNVLELLPQSYADALLPELIRCARAGAVVCVRSIFPRHKDRTFDDRSGALVFDRELTDAAQERDRSLFCNFYEVYRRA